jgi:hypothetical protein
MMESLLKNCYIEKGINYTSAGTSDTLNSDIFDLQGYDSICLIAVTGDVTNTAVGTLKAYIGDDSALADGAYATTTSTFTADATSADYKVVVLDVVKPGKRYVRADFVRATANIVLENVIAIKYNARTLPVTQGSDVVDSDLSVNRG